MFDPCTVVKTGEIDYGNFGDFMVHVGRCNDCQRRIAAQIEIAFKQKTMGDL